MRRSLLQNSIGKFSRIRLWLLAPLFLTGCFVPGGGWTLRTGWDFRTCRKPAFLYLEMVDTRWDEWNRVAVNDQGQIMATEVVTVVPSATSETQSAYPPAGSASDNPSSNSGSVPEPMPAPLNRSNPPVPGLQEDSGSGPTAIRTSANLPAREVPAAKSASSGFIERLPPVPQRRAEPSSDADRSSDAELDMPDDDEDQSDKEYEADTEAAQVRTGTRSRMAKIQQVGGPTSRGTSNRKPVSQTSATRESEGSAPNTSDADKTPPRKKLPPGAWLFRRPGK